MYGSGIRHQHCVTTSMYIFGISVLTASMGGSGISGISGKRARRASLGDASARWSYSVSIASVERVVTLLRSHDTPDLKEMSSWLDLRRHVG